MPFTPTNFQNGNPATPVSATQLNKLGTQYAAVAADAGNPATPVGAALSTAIEAAINASGSGSGWDIIPVLGQSNALGRGTPIDPALDGERLRVFQLANLSSPYPDVVVPALEPLFHQELPGQTVGFPLTFAKLYAAAHLDRKVLLVPCARGNTGFGSTGDYTWRVGQAGPINLHSLAVAQINKALELPDSRVAAILWHQGEANSSTNPTTYRTDLDNLINDLRTRYGADVPFVLGQMSPTRITANPTTYGAIDDVHRDTVNRLDHIGYWYSSNLLESDGLHFSAAGNRVNGVTAYAAFNLALNEAGGIAGTDLTDEPGFNDTFERADGPLGTATSGETWQVLGYGSGNTTHIWNVVGGSAQLTQGQAVMQATIDGLSADGVITQVIDTVGTGHVGGIAIRAQDNANFIILSWRTSSGDFRYALQKRVAGTNSNIQVASSVQSADGDVIEVTLNGSSIIVEVNGVEIINATDSSFVTATRHGLYGANADMTGKVESIQFVAA